MEFLPTDISRDDIGRHHQQQHLKFVWQKNGVENRDESRQNQKDIFAEYSEKSENQHYWHRRNEQCQKEKARHLKVIYDADKCDSDTTDILEEIGNCNERLVKNYEVNNSLCYADSHNIANQCHQRAFPVFQDKKRKQDTYIIYDALVINRETESETESRYDETGAVKLFYLIVIQ